MANMLDGWVETLLLVGAELDSLHPVFVLQKQWEISPTVFAFHLLPQATEQERHDLGAGAGGVGAESRIGGAEGNTVFHSPQHRIGVVGVCRHVFEGIHRTGRMGCLKAPQEGHDLRPGAGCTEAEGGIAGALGDALLTV